MFAVAPVNWYSIATILIAVISSTFTLMRYLDAKEKDRKKEIKKARLKAQRERRIEIVEAIKNETPPIVKEALAEHMVEERELSAKAAGLAASMNDAVAQLAVTVTAHLNEDAAFQREVWKRLIPATVPVRDKDVSERAG